MITRYFAYFVTNTFKVLHKKGEAINVPHIATLYYIKYVCCVGGKSHQGDEDVCQPVDPSKSRFAFLLACFFLRKSKGTNMLQNPCYSQKCLFKKSVLC